jgi:hypothetical protein
MQYTVWAGIFDSHHQFLTEHFAVVEATKMIDAISEAMRQIADQHHGCRIRIIEAKLQSGRRYEDVDKYTDL